MTIRTLKRSIATAALALTSIGCGSTSDPEQPPAATEGAEHTQDPQLSQPEPPAPEPRTAKAEFKTVPNVELQGEAHFTAEPDGVRAHVAIEKASPGKHGIHVHEKGDCSDIAGKSMGTHFTPEGNPHGLPGAAAHHLGDLGNIEVAADGKGQLEIKVPQATLDDGPNSFAGKALVIHEKQDVGTGPTGESGSPIACAVIAAE